VGQAQTQLSEFNTRFPNDSFANRVFTPTVRALIELAHNNPAQALQLLETARGYEMGQAASMWPVYIRALAYLKQRAAPEAIAEFQRLLDHRGITVIEAFYSLAHVGIGRAATLQAEKAAHDGDNAARDQAMAVARKAYQDFFALWKDADSDIPILREAKAEYERIK
jgi:hypothetical protein